MNSWQVIVTLLVFWVIVLVYLSTTINTSSGNNGRTEQQLQAALNELENLKKQNAELQQLANDIRDIRELGTGGGNAVVRKLKDQLENSNKELENVKRKLAEQTSVGDRLPQLSRTEDEPGQEHEEIRRKVENGVTEIWFYIQSELKKLRDSLRDNIGAQGKITEILQDGRHQQQSILTDLHSLSLSDGTGAWREREAKELSELVQRRLHYLQNPKDCASAKKLLCNINKGCGYGCQLHHVTYCFILAYSTERTLILESKGWRYNSQGWEAVFKPVSDTCTAAQGGTHKNWGPPEAIKDVAVVTVPIVDSLFPRPPQLPLAIPEDLAPRLLRLHGDPFVWWMGQLLKYLLRPQPHLQQDLEKTKEKMGLKNPVVGIHVRRTDKVGTEAAFHGIEEYMVHAEEYFDLLEHRQPIEKRQIYLASDDASVLPDARKKYPKYEFLGDQEIARSAGLGSRYSDSSLRGIIMDIHYLSLCDYLVCTFSSQVCRVAYEIMQTLHPDASKKFHSLDDVYYFGGQNAHDQEAIYPHVPRHGSEIELNIGDIVGIAGNHWDGYSKGINKRTGKTGLYPSYKVKEKINIAKFPAYLEAEKRR